MTGLVPAFLYADGTPGWASNDAWVRDNVYTCISIWGMSVAFRRQADSEEDRLTAFQLEQVGVSLVAPHNVRGGASCVIQYIGYSHDLWSQLTLGVYIVHHVPA